MNVNPPPRKKMLAEPWVEAEKIDRTRRWRQVLGALLSILIMIALAAAAFLFLPRLPNGSLYLGLRVFLLVVGGLLPILIYGFFARNRLPTLFVEYKQNLRRLGLPENSEIYQKKFETVYGRTPEMQPAAQPFLISETPVVITTLFCLFGWFIVFFPFSEAETLAPNLSEIGFGFLGAYIFSIGALTRFYLQDDLQTRYYASLIARFVTVLVLSWLVGLMVSYLNPQGVNQDLVLLAAFVIGIFPNVGLSTIQRIGTQIFGIALSGYQEEFPLTKLDGFNAYSEDRLVLEGIENQQNMASANIVDLMLRTRYPVEQIVDWVDQALLHLHTRERIEAFRKCGYRTATDFLDAFYGIDQAQIADLTRWREQMAGLLLAQFPADSANPMNQQNALTLLETVAISLHSAPNFFHVRYWRTHEFEALPEDVERFRTQADLKLIQGLKDEAIEAYQRVVEQFPNSLATRLYLGLAYFQKKDYSKAIREYEQLIEQAGSQRETLITAHLELGRAYREDGEAEKARLCYEKALELDNDNLEAHLDLAYLQMAHLNEYSQAIDHLKIVIERGFRKAEALANRGLARLELWKRSRAGLTPAAGASEGQSLLEEARADLQQALRLNPGMTAAIINLAIVHQEAGEPAAALDRLDEVVRRLEPEPGKPPTDLENAYRARLMRGNIHFGMSNFALAVENYKAATRIAPYDAAAFYNLGVAYQQLARNNPEALEEARRAYQEAIQLKPGHALAHQAVGDLYRLENDSEQAEISYQTALRLSRERGDAAGQALARLSLGRLYRSLGRVEEARSELIQVSRLADELNDDLTYTEALFELGLLDLGLAQQAEAPVPAAFGRAAGQLETAAALFEALNQPRQAARVALQLGTARLGEGKPAEALQNWGRAKKLLEAVFDPLNPEDAALLQAIETALNS